jgi:hypothetical protein
LHECKLYSTAGKSTEYFVLCVVSIVFGLEPQGTKKRERPKKTWRRSVMEEAQREGRTWREVKRLAADRNRWKCFVEALCSYTGDNRK